MAKADDTSSTIDGIWLRDALVLAAAPFGSAVLAKERLREWMASGQLPWSCMSFEGPDADDITRLREEERELIVGYILPWAAYHKSDPAFWCADLTIWWNKNAAREKSGFGARALGIKVSHEHLLGLLPGEPLEHVEKPSRSRQGQQSRSAGAKGQADPDRSIEKTHPQSERAERYIKKNFPRGTDGITTAIIREKLAQDGKLQEELKELGRKLFSATVINRVLGRRKK